MIFNASLEQTEDGEFIARCEDPMAIAQGMSSKSALERLRSEIRYQIELCPCSGVDEDFVELRLDD